MSIRRTKQDKIAAQLQRDKIEYRYSFTDATSVSTRPTSRSKDKASIFGYDVKLIYGDLLKTVLVAASIVTLITILAGQLGS